MMPAVRDRRDDHPLQRPDLPPNVEVRPEATETTHNRERPDHGEHGEPGDNEECDRKRGRHAVERMVARGRDPVEPLTEW